MGRGIGSALGLLLGIAAVVGVVWLLLVGIIENCATTVTKSIIVPSTRGFKHWEFVAQERHSSYQAFHFNYVSKRRVPNGPDPIHNRRAAKSRQPQGRV